MAVFRVERTRDYTVMCNHHLKDSNLSLKAKGLLSMMLSLPDEWNYTTRGLAAICKEGVDAIGKTLKELELAGYIIRRQLRGKDGRISDTEYTIFEKPRKPSPPDTTLALEHRVKQLTNFIVPPNKRTLKIRQTDAAIAYILDQIPDFTGDILKQFFSHIDLLKSSLSVYRLSGTISTISSIRQSSAAQIFTSISVVTCPFRPILVTDAGLMPAFSHKSFFFMSLSMSSFQSFL